LIGDGALAAGDDEDALEEQRALIWRHLLPSTWAVAVRGFDAARAPALLELFDREHVAYHQMHVARERDRSYPLGRQQVLGRWGYIDRPLAERRALVDLGFQAREVEAEDSRALAVESLAAEEAARFRALTWRHLATPIALSGLERACDLLLSDERWSFLDDRQASYSFRRDRSLRGKLARSYFLASNEASETPRVVTTLEAPLQREVGRLLERLMEEHRPAIAMAIVLEVASGDVLAVDAREAYELSGFAPLYHEFTPGSTFKVPVMACAIESGAVAPDDVFDVGHGSFQIEGRTITEAESARTGRLTVAECLAHSVNAGLVQIGTRVEPGFFRGQLARLHYGVAPDSGLGGERAGSVPPLPWKRAWEHASVSFGYELRMSLWQHAAALASIVRGGEYRPLRIVDAVEQNGARYDLPRAEPEPVFSRATADTVRWMMEMGAREGTGRVVASPDLVPGLIVGTKTGTAQKVATEVCLHEELAHQAAHRAAQTACSRACRSSLVGRRSGHRSCYTSSMCAFGRRAEGGREVLVLVVADEPRGREKFGARVAGPTAIAILKEALGATRLGAPAVPDVVAGFAPSPCASQAGFAQPWAEEVLE
jgi:cell division protein FtsI/penicillin-binding protein 2